MFISLHELELRRVLFAVEIPPGEIEYDSKVGQSSGLRANGTAELLSRSLGEIRVSGKLTVTLQAACDRCLEKALFPIERPFDLVYVPAEESAVPGEKAIDQVASEIGYYEGNGLELNDVLREVVLLALPMQLTCDETCKGICPACGQNRNQQDCTCRVQAIDDRWGKLKSFRVEAGPRS